jgi:UDP-N-acetylmuramoyl-tripeptide--D-alanyl-D-alanine ligase
MKNIFKKIIIAILTVEAKLVLKKYHPRIVAITGSVGKTSTKDALYAVLQKQFFVRRSLKSFNSEFGVPLTILDCPTGWTNPFIWIKNIGKGLSLILFKHHYPEWLILEVGADRPGDIEKVSKWLPADVVIYTRFGDTPVHVEFFRSVDHLIKEKSFLMQALKKDGILILNSDDKNVLALKERSKNKVFTYGFNEKADIRADNINIMYEGDVPVGLMFKLEYAGKSMPVRMKNVLGQHQVYVALSAITAAFSLEIPPTDVLEALADYMPPSGRMRLIEGLKGSMVIDDTYNASPTAVLAGLETVKNLQVKGKKIAILGDMLELGSYAVNAHKDVGTKVSEACDYLFVVGPRSHYTVEAALEGGMSDKNVIEFKSSREAGKYAEGILGAGDVVFIKGSQSMRMEKAVEEIMLHPEDREKLLVRQEKEWQTR